WKRTPMYYEFLNRSQAMNFLRWLATRHSSEARLLLQLASMLCFSRHFLRQSYDHALHAVEKPVVQQTRLSLLLRSSSRSLPCLRAFGQIPTPLDSECNRDMPDLRCSRGVFRLAGLARQTASLCWC
ncbi:hypothetical protein PFISCL1PPCAC_7379, partial [Pristionchus fissidentatus]